VSHRGHYIFRVDASSLVAPYDAGASRAPELRSVAMTSQVQLPFTERMGAYLAGAPPARPARAAPERAVTERGACRQCTVGPGCRACPRACSPAAACPNLLGELPAFRAH